MTELLKIENENGLFKTVLPPFDNRDWPKVFSTHGFIWIHNPHVDFSNQLDSLIADTIFKRTDLDLKCSIHRMEFDISIPAIDFLSCVENVFQHGIEIIHSEKHQPVGFDIYSIPKSMWLREMKQNQVNLTFHRPAGGEPSVLTSPDQDLLNSIIQRFTTE